jgi:hypothetical protein
MKSEPMAIATGVEFATLCQIASTDLENSTFIWPVAVSIDLAKVM